MTGNSVEKKKYFNKIFTFFLGGKSKKQFIRYIIIGFSSFILEYLLFFTLFKLIGINELVSSPIAIAVVFWFNYLMNRYWSFKSKGKLGRQLILYLLLFAFNTLISNLFIYGGTNLLQLSPLISKVMIMGLIVLWNFVIYKKIIYRT